MDPSESDYERMRRENIAANERVLAGLGRGHKLTAYM